MPSRLERASCPSRRSTNSESATITHAPPSALRAHSSLPVRGAIDSAASTSSSESGTRVSASGWRNACRLMSTGTIASCSLVTLPISSCHCATRSYPCGMHGDGSGATGSRQPASARSRKERVSIDATASPATTATAWQRSVRTMRAASSSPVTGPAPPVSSVRTVTFFCGRRPTLVAKKCASMKCGCEREGTAISPSRSFSCNPLEARAFSSADCMSTDAGCRSLPRGVMPYPTIRTVLRNPGIPSTGVPWTRKVPCAATP
mmetsp:Transcript_24768/g.59799  ORF Transcript_24768/g.59799 Transcript_24768/m.59799 type:complete len:262 (-) Transcript_24768:181-966(-)